MTATVQLSRTDPVRSSLAAFAYWLQQYRRTWRGTVVISVANPALFLTALGFGLGKLVDAHHSHYLHGHSYLAFLAPGLVAAAMMQTAYITCAGPVFNAARPGGAYRSAVATPIEPGEVFAGHVLFAAFRVLTSGAAFAIIAALYGAVSPARAVPLVGAALATGLAFTAPVAAWAVTVDRASGLNACFRFVIMPMYMFSGTFFSTAQLPTWLRVVAECTPLYQGTALCRAATLGGSDPQSVLLHLAYLLAVFTAGLWFGARTYRRVLTA